MSCKTTAVLLLKRWSRKGGKRGFGGLRPPAAAETNSNWASLNLKSWLRLCSRPDNVVVTTLYQPASHWHLPWSFNWFRRSPHQSVRTNKIVYQIGDVLNRYFWVTVPSDYFRKGIRYFISITCIRSGNHESKTFFYFGLHPMFGGKLGVERREDPLFLVIIQCLVEMCTLLSSKWLL